MQSKGAIKFVAILLLFASLWQLSFTAISNKQVKNAEMYAENAAAEYVAKADSSFLNLSADEQNVTLEPIKSRANRFYLDSIYSEKVYLGYTMREVQEKSINLGLDLKGGMNVMLKVKIEDIVAALAGQNPCEEFTTALNAATERSKNKESKVDFVDLFAEEWQNTNSEKSLSSVFKIEGDDAAVIAAVKEKANSAIDNSFKILSKRIDRFGVTQPNIQKISGGNGRILIELPGVKEPERVKTLLQGRASLEFWPSFYSSEVYDQFLEAEKVIAASLAADSTASATPLRDILALENTKYARIGIARKADMEKIDEYLCRKRKK